ncbi:murein biosynthesis integral membrane protein MurJ [Thiorhodovibrio frisius]|uniref:Probable lipid II flippase MurJ n=1 Tax=Thiorhodovibrio frisius TaxID=631362 RepID=H8Z0W3_9GAMM|nr:murein biosynthesis integral membrane protein MurJ [Thiorhodovibrio frisius]EIC21345.1 integral membrane protein MviN [Thiorhodovibrio frisius]WPL23930.1 putative peptidoglycan biosynthesis protein MurJ [Thiorhodovibrio frisius]
MSQAEPSASLAGSVARVGGGTLISRLLGFARDLLIARLFGASQATDAFFVAFRIPNLMRRLFAEGAFAATLIPALTHAGGQHLQDQDSTRKLISEFTGSLTALLLLITGLGLLAAPLLVWLLAPGFSAETQQLQLTTALLRLTLPYLLFIGLTALAGAVLNSYEHFAIPALTPALLNLSLIGCALLLAPRLEQPVFALAWGVLFGGVAQLALQVAALARLGLLVTPSINWHSPELTRLLAAMGPTLIGMSVTQINLLLDTLLASFLIAGSISWLYYAERLMDFPLGILGAALGTAILPRLARTHASGHRDDFNVTLDWALRWTLLLGLPAAAGLLVLAEPIIAILFRSDHFGAQDIHQAQRALMAYALGLPFFMAYKVVAPGFFSRNDLKTPLRIGLISMAANLLLSLLLMVPFGHVGLALATSLASALGAGLLLRAMLRADHAKLQPGWSALLLRTTLGTAVMMLLIAWMSAKLPLPTEPGFAKGLLPLIALVLTGAIVYPLMLLMLGFRARHIRPKRQH